MVNECLLPRIDDILDYLGGSTVYSKLDLATGYQKLATELTCTYKTALQSCLGLYGYVVSPLSSARILLNSRGP